jgi:tetratricopeptide (TPR) repeat protein
VLCEPNATPESRNDGLKHLEEALRLRQAIFGAHPETAETLLALGRAYLLGGHLDEAEERLRRAWKQFPDRDPREGQCLAALGDIYMSRKNPSEAQHFYQQALDILRETSAAASAELIKQVEERLSAIAAPVVS